MTKATQVVVVGIGQAGFRFLRACMAINSGSFRLTVVAAVDVREEKRPEMARLGVPWFASVAEAAAVVAADVAIVTVPEIHHFEVLRDLKRCFPALRRILCEKPLVANAWEAAALERIFADDDISINFVERLSPIVEDFRRFVRSRRRRIVRVHCVWGKYRIKDERPTRGVIHVELAHPLDLVLMLAGVSVGTSFEIVSVVATRSDFDVGCSQDLPLDTVSLSLVFAGGPHVVISTSLLWPSRRRSLELFLADEDGVASEMAVLAFDDPLWDLDRLEVFDIRSRSGRPSLVHSMEVTREDWPQDRFTIGKVCRFLEANLDEMNGGSHDLPRLGQGVYVQDILEKVTIAAENVAVPLRCFADIVGDQTSTTSRTEFLSRMNDGERIAPDEFVWDHHF